MRAFLTVLGFLVAAGLPQAVAQQNGGDIVHDAEYYILKAQNGETPLRKG